MTQLMWHMNRSDAHQTGASRATLAEFERKLGDLIRVNEI